VDGFHWLIRYNGAYRVAQYFAPTKSETGLMGTRTLSRKTLEKDASGLV
jgi:hypothetical protein